MMTLASGARCVVAAEQRVAAGDLHAFVGVDGGIHDLPEFDATTHHPASRMAQALEREGLADVRPRGHSKQPAGVASGVWPLDDPDATARASLPFLTTAMHWLPTLASACVMAIVARTLVLPSQVSDARPAPVAALAAAGAHPASARTCERVRTLGALATDAAAARHPPSDAPPRADGATPCAR